MKLTPAQQQAIAARGNVLVVAGAGTGKTRTLVERCLSCLLDEQSPASLDQILVVTFTEAAAAEMRQRLRDRLEQERRSHGHRADWHEHLALFESAHIGTLHSFCLQLVRQHFYQLELDPQLSVLSEQEARLLAEETLDDLLKAHYGGTATDSQAVQHLIQTHARGREKPIRDLVFRLHQYSQSLPSPAAWLAAHSALFAQLEPTSWRRWLSEALHDWRWEALAILTALPAANQVAVHCRAAFTKMTAQASPEEFGALFVELNDARTNCPLKKTTAWLEPLDEFFADADFLASLLPEPGQAEPLVQDWSWARVPMATLLSLAAAFSGAFTDAKRELGVVDFQDLEQHALRLLYDPGTGGPTTIARHWREQLRFVFVDEYQDINPAQDLILQMLSRPDPQANRFLVGDVKQSIYRFRLANPRIFRTYAEMWSTGPGQTIPLVENFRSREAILDFINSLFGLLMRRELGGIDYDKNAGLRFGAPEERAVLGRAGTTSSPGVELHLLAASGVAVPEADDPVEGVAEVLDLPTAEKEARLVALRLKELRATQHPVWDEQSRQFRPVDWKDMAVLLRSPAKKAESYAKEFARLGLPLHVARGSFYQSREVSDLLSLLQVLDNPLQDVPVLAVLRSPLVGLSANELARIRLSVKKVRFWVALLHWHKKEARANDSFAEKVARGESSGRKAETQTHRRVGVFLARFARWRRLARQLSLSKCLEAILAETHYDSWLLTQPRGPQRHANLQGLLTLALDFDQFQRQGLFRFLRFVEAQQASALEPEVRPSAAQNAVRLMSIHQSKGLEFPVVVVADLGKPFNLTDLSAEIILDEEFGLCPQIKPPHTGKRYPSLPYWLARRRQRNELLGEELRLLYVAMTRARDLLLLTGTLTKSGFQSKWLATAPEAAALPAVPRRYTDWLAPWFARTVGVRDSETRTGACSLLRWSLHEPADLTEPASPSEEAAGAVPIDFTSVAWRALEKELSWKYPFTSATTQPAKTSASLLRGRTAAADAEETAPLFRTAPE